jgi:hypothetical protein
MTPLERIKEIKAAMTAEATTDHRLETIDRAFIYAGRRIDDGSVKTAQEAANSMAAFADGFCTGFHRGSGTQCER